MQQHESSRAVNAISNRLSLRVPQRESLAILAHLCEILPLQKNQDVTQSLQAVISEFPAVQDFEREFPSLCFSLATGVGKTRLMGAFIAYLSQMQRLKHFFVLAPNLTIYNKLVAEFREPSHPKYVFKGLSEFVSTPPEVITGDDYDSGKSLFRNLEEGVHINIFNISKINSEVRGGAAPRIHRLSEYIGTSYFDYLASLKDLVLLMDESHRYRGSAGAKAINELKPILGLELTATPKVTGVNGSVFKNVIYSYPLSTAMADGFVKEPAVVTRENFRPQDYDDATLELVKLEDGVRVHEHTKVELETFSLQTGKTLVRPFMLVVAQDTNHADELEALIKSEKFFGGRYSDKVITVHSNQTGELKDESVERLLVVEKADSERAPEIVIHVNKLGEGWDVSNLYTIVPLRRFVADILTEQTLGRGLRLPYGRRTGNDAVDTLHIVAHDKFQAIIDEARNPNSIIKKQVVIGRDILAERKVAVTVQPSLTPQVAVPGEPPNQRALVFRTESERRVAQIAVEVVRQFEYLPRSADLRRPEVKAQFVKEVKRLLSYDSPAQSTLGGTVEPTQSDVEAVVTEVTERIVDLTIDIPRIVMQPKGETMIRFADFDLDTSTINYQTVDSDLLVESLPTGKRWKLSGGESINIEERFENYIVRGLIDKSDVDYGSHPDLLYKLAGQVIARLRSYLREEDQLVKVLLYYQRQLTEFVYAQMQQHRFVAAVEYEVKVSKGFETLKPTSFDALASEAARDFRNPVEERLLIRGMSFSGFLKCLYPVQKFQSDAERRLAVVLENDAVVMKWFKPASKQFRIHLPTGDYEPDFVVETETEKLLIEPKRSDLLTDSVVLAKADAAVRWCKHASDHELAHGGKPWKYLLIPDNAINAAMSLQGLTAAYQRQ
jgi:type III restriction enzyme